MIEPFVILENQVGLVLQMINHLYQWCDKVPCQVSCYCHFGLVFLHNWPVLTKIILSIRFNWSYRYNNLTLALYFERSKLFYHQVSVEFSGTSLSHLCQEDISLY
jgi:hypothetical protein